MGGMDERLYLTLHSINATLLLILGVLVETQGFFTANDADKTTAGFIVCFAMGVKVYVYVQRYRLRSGANRLQ